MDKWFLPASGTNPPDLLAKFRLFFIYTSIFDFLFLKCPARHRLSYKALAGGGEFHLKNPPYHCTSLINFINFFSDINSCVLNLPL